MSGNNTITSTSATTLASVLMLAWLVNSSKACAGEVFWSDWQFNGFGTIGYINSDKYGERVPRRGVYQDGQRVHDNGFLMDSRIGMQVKGDLNDHWSVVGQMVLREQYDSKLTSFVDIAFVKYQGLENWEVGIGRQAFDLFFMSDHRNTGYSYEWVRPPTQFYGFMPYESFDGIKLSKRWGDFDNDWKWSFSYGDVSAKFEDEVYAEDDEIDDIKADPIISTELLWQTGKWRVRGSVAYFKLEQDIELKDEFEFYEQYITPQWAEFSKVARDFSNSNSFVYGSLGLAWEHDDWKVQTEWNTIDTDFIGFSGERGYFSVSRRFGDWQPYIYASYSSDDQKVKYPRPPMEASPWIHDFYQEVYRYMKGLRHNERAVGIGARWDFAPQKALKFQCDKYYFDANSGSVFGRADENYANNEQNSWCSAAFDWVF